MSPTPLRIEREPLRLTRNGQVWRYTWEGGGECTAGGDFEAARAVLAQNPDAPTHAEVWMAGKHCMTLDLRKAAGLRVADDDRGLRIRKYVPFAGGTSIRGEANEGQDAREYPEMKEAAE